MKRDRYLKNLYRYEIFIDGEGRYDNYSITGYVAADDQQQAKDYMRAWHEKRGDKVIKVALSCNYDLVDVAH